MFERPENDTKWTCNKCNHEELTTEDRLPSDLPEKKCPKCGDVMTPMPYNPLGPPRNPNKIY